MPDPTPEPTPVPQRLSIVTLGVSDLARSIDFYESIGWVRAAESQPAIAFFRMQGSALALFPHAELAHDAGLDLADDALPEFRGVTCALNCDSTDEVDSVFARWVAAGARPVKHPEKVFWGGYSSYVADPDGHLWEIAHNPLMPNDDAGAMRLT
jgi:hypothetical protein